MMLTNSFVCLALFIFAVEIIVKPFKHYEA